MFGRQRQTETRISSGARSTGRLIPRARSPSADHGPEFCAEAVKVWLKRLEVDTLFIEPGSPWETGFIESFNGKLRDELLNGEISSTLKEAQTLIGDRRAHYFHIHPHSSLGCRFPAPEAWLVPKIQPHRALFPYNEPSILFRVW